MKIKYLGPQDKVTVAPYGKHLKNQVKDYPDDFGEVLLSSSKRQRFEKIKPTKTIFVKKQKKGGLKKNDQT